MLKNLKIIHKIILFSLVMLLFIGVVGFAGYFFNSKSNDSMTSMYSNSLLTVKQLNEARAEERASQADILNIILNSKTYSAQQPYIADIEKRTKNFDKNWSAYKNKELDEYEKTTVRLITVALAAFRDTRSSIIQFAGLGNQAEAYKMYKESANIIDALENALQGLADYNSKAADKIYSKNKSDFQKSQIIIISVILLGLIMGFLMATLIIAGIVRPLRFLKRALDDLVEKGGDLTHKINIKTNDEIGDLSNSVNKFLSNLRDIIDGVITEARNVENEVLTVNSNIVELNENISDVSSTTEQLSAGMEQTAASTEEMNATSTEIEKGVSSIAEKAEEGARAAAEIKIRANELKNTAIASQQNAADIYSHTHDELLEAIKESKAVEEINTLSSAIMSITDQTNLLALNAAIEAARAGEAGKGFAVVADEIRKLADQSKSTASQIQDITKTVVTSVDNLSVSAEKVLTFIDKQVVKDYEMIVKTGEQYSTDAEMINNLVEDFSATSQELLASMDNMINSINEITSATNEGALGSSNIANGTTQIVNKTENVLDHVNSAKSSADNLIELVAKFKV